MISYNIEESPNIKQGQEQIKCFSGAGIILVESYTNEKNEKEYSIILFRETKTQLYQDGGGKLNKGEEPCIGAMRELKEESANLFNINEINMANAYSVVLRNIYKCYFVCIKTKDFKSKDFKSKEDFKFDNYYHNTKLIQNNVNLSEDYKQTDNITRITLNDYNIAIINSQKNTPLLDHNNNLVLLRERTRLCIKQALKKNFIHKIKISVLELYNNDDQTSPFYKTITYK